MYILHITNKNYSSWSLRPWALMKTLGIPFTEQLHPFPADGAWQQFRNFAPNGKVPCLEDGATRVWDSLAITEYLAEQHSGVWPVARAARAWGRCVAAEMHSGFQALRNQCGMSCGVRIKMREINSILSHDLMRIDEIWTEGLERFGGPYLAGANFSAADAFFAPVAFRVQTYGLPLSAPATDYCQRLLNESTMREWYEAALGETWREPLHEQEVLAVGELLADHRHLV